MDDMLTSDEMKWLRTLISKQDLKVRGELDVLALDSLVKRGFARVYEYDDNSKEWAVTPAGRYYFNNLPGAAKPKVTVCKRAAKPMHGYRKTFVSDCRTKWEVTFTSDDKIVAFDLFHPRCKTPLECKWCGQLKSKIKKQFKMAKGVVA